MKTSEFVQLLESNPNAKIHYNYQDKFRVLPFVHLTELKNIIVESVDCGGKKNNWNETVMQLWTGATVDDGHRLDATGILKIYQKVMSVTKVDLNSELYIEYGDSNNAVTQYAVSVDNIEENVIKIGLNARNSECKGMSGDNACCAPKVVKVAPQMSCCGSTTTSNTNCC